jgi:hypothetical protein
MSIKRFCFAAVLLLCFVLVSSAENQDGINNSVKKYIEGDYQAAAALLKEARMKDPGNEYAKKLMLKILMEQSSQNSIKQNYPRALKYLEEARKIDPENKKVNEMYELTRKLMSTNPKSLSAVIAKNPAEFVSLLLTSNEVPIKQGERLTNANLRATLFWTVLSTALFLAFLVLFIFKSMSAAKLKKELNTLKMQIKRVNDDRGLLLNKLSEARDESTRERIALMAQNLFEYNPGEALNFLMNMAEHTNAVIRSNVVHALAQIAQPETLEMLFQLYKDPDYRVKGQVLKSLKNIERKVENKEITVDAVNLNKLRYMLNEEKSKSEWIF